MLNKKIIILVLLLGNTTAFASNIIGIGQIGDKFIYKIGGILVSLSVGDIVDGCTIRGGSGLQCDDSFDKNLGTQSTVEKLNKIEDFYIDNRYMKGELIKLSRDNRNLTIELDSIKKSYAKKINKRNLVLNKLSLELNNIR